MFKSNEDENQGINSIDDTIVGSSIKIEGDLTSNGSIVVEGEVVGSIKTAKTLKVGENAKIVADITAEDSFISGKVQGNISIKNKLELSDSAEINGDIQAGTLIISAGAIFNGQCSMTEIKNPVPVKQEEKESKKDE